MREAGTGDTIWSGEEDGPGTVEIVSQFLEKSSIDSSSEGADTPVLLGGSIYVLEGRRAAQTAGASARRTRAPSRQPRSIAVDAATFVAARFARKVTLAAISFSDFLPPDLASSINVWGTGVSFTNCPRLGAVATRDYEDT